MVSAGDDESANVQFAVASVHVSVTFGAENTAVNAAGVEITLVAVLTGVLKNDPPDVKAERLNVYVPAVTPVDTAVFPVIERFGTAGDDERENVHPVVASDHAKFIVEPVDTAVNPVGVATI